MLDNKSSILVTGGLGYIGSHTVLDLFSDTQFHIIILDDLSNCKLDVLDRMKQILQDQSHLK
jgi:UDP-glucose 4-epimerase